MKRNRAGLTVAGLFIVLAIIAAPGAEAATYTIPNVVDTVDGNGNYNFVGPGDTLLIPSSRTAPIWFQNLHGTATQWITIKNTGGQVTINGAGDPDAVRILFCEYIQITGTGDTGVTYGFKINGGLAVWPWTRFVEADHIEIFNSRAAGFGAHNRYGSGNWDVPPTSSWIQKDTTIHDCYIHDVGTEGMYIGHTLDGQNGVISAGVYVYDNILKNIGWEAIQMASSTGIDCHGNRIANTHLNPKSGQPGSGILTLEYSEGHIYNNVIIRTRQGILVQSGAGIHKIYNNTIVDSETFGIQSFVGGNPAIEYYDNIIAGYGKSEAMKIQSGAAFNNLADTNPLNIGFVDYNGGDYHLTADSPAVDAGSPTGYAPFDFDGVSRPQGNSADMGAYENGGNTNALLNPSFENGNGKPENWLKYGPGVTIAKSSAGKTDGSFSCRVTNRTARYHGVRQNMIDTIVNNQTYRASIDIRLDSGADEVRLNFYCNGQLETMARAANVPAGTWITISSDYTISWTGSPRYAYFEIWCDNATTSYNVDNAGFFE